MVSITENLPITVSGTISPNPTVDISTTIKYIQSKNYFFGYWFYSTTYKIAAFIIIIENIEKQTLKILLKTSFEFLANILSNLLIDKNLNTLVNEIYSLFL